jgi:NDP-sugar pyrophosphorylase family protein
MRAMILAAGEGIRLRPLTYICPKVLAPVVNIPVIDRTIEYLRSYGVHEIIMNAYHLHRKIIDYLKYMNNSCSKIEIRIEKDILGTGGGIKNTEGFWGKEPFIVINGDILTNIDLRKIYEFHKRKNNLVTMVLHNYPRYNKIVVDSYMNILSIGPGVRLERALAFTGIHIISPDVIDYIPKNRQYDILKCYKELINQKKFVRGYLATGHRWIDIGTIQDYIKANFNFLPPNKKATGPNCHIDLTAIEEDWVVIGKESSIEKGATVKRSILWDNVVVKGGVKVIDSIVTSGVIVKKDLYGSVAIKS